MMHVPVIYLPYNRDYLSNVSYTSDKISYLQIKMKHNLLDHQTYQVMPDFIILEELSYPLQDFLKMQGLKLKR